jgi:hypothetical protein
LCCVCVFYTEIDMHKYIYMYMYGYLCVYEYAHTYSLVLSTEIATLIAVTTLALRYQCHPPIDRN